MNSASTVGALQRRINVALGSQPADIVLRGGRILNVFTGDLTAADVAICDGIIASIGSYRGAREIDVAGAIVLPGFIDGHIHVESTMLSPGQFARAISSRGATTAICDPHEIANVAGLDGVRYMLDGSRGGPVDLRIMAPSCVPATHLETAGASLGPDAVKAMLRWPGIHGLAEMMNFPGVLAGASDALRKLAAAASLPIDGHCPGLSGAELQAYIATGPRTEHEATSLDEAREKLAAGMWLLIREGSTARNLADLAPLLTGEGARRCLLVSDDRNPVDLLESGHLDETLRRAVGAGVPPLRAVQAATLNAADCFRLHDRGAVAPGLRADLAVVEDLRDFEVRMTLRGGIPVDEIPDPPEPGIASVRGSMNVAGLSVESFSVPSAGEQARARVIEVVPGQVLTGAGEALLQVRGGLVQPDPERDIAKLAVIERHRGSGRTGLGFVRGLGLTRGALASTVAHDSHNLVVAGVSDEAMLRAARALIEVGGGQCAADDDGVLALLPLPIGGLMSDHALGKVAEGVRAMQMAARQLGSALEDPLMALSFLALPVIPRLKLTDRGLVDVASFDYVPLLLPL
ncbi:MAG: adenine deaminase [candidate division WS1 bacterium]|nr:adenine deaminase [candidate division WS1 bacterium]